MPIDWVLYGVWAAGYLLLRGYAKQQEEEERRKNIVGGVTWTIADEFGGAPGTVASHIRQILTGDFEWHVQSAAGSVINLWRGDFTLTTVPAQRDLSWNEVPVNLTVTLSRAGPSKTRVELKFAAPPAVEFNRDCQELVLRVLQAGMVGYLRARPAALPAVGQGWLEWTPDVPHGMARYPHRRSQRVVKRAPVVNGALQSLCRCISPRERDYIRRIVEWPCQMG